MRSNITRWLSLLALMALLFFGLGEVLSRALNLVDRANGFPRKLFVAAPETGLSYRMRPGVDGTVRGVPVRTNQLGFRGPEVEPVPGPAVRRVVILGDSVTFGFRMPETEIFPTLIAEQLAETTDAPWEILNFGVEGYNTVAELEVLRSTALDLRPETVVLVLNLNDYDETPSVGPRGVLTLNREETISAWSPAHVSEFYLLLQWLIRTGGSVWFGEPAPPPSSAAVSTEFEPLDLYVSALRKEYWRNPTDSRMATMHAALREIKRETEERNIGLLIVILPDGDQIGAAKADMIPQIRLEKICAEEELDCLDLHPVFAQSQTPNLFMDIMHPNAAGHALVAEAIASRLGNR
ncbi:MAG TPA: hypothetical protein DCG06_01220 [Deltaproteobacteria bacterium]|nr:hypothetical protein [Deltaproteobacteria bacterium]